MRPIDAMIVLALLLGGCELFKKIERDSARLDVKEACGDFCEAWIHATYDCLDDTGDCPAGVPSFSETKTQCKDECIEIANDLNDDDMETASECMWCVIDEVGTAPDCLDFYDDEWNYYLYIDACEWECGDVESLLGKWNWPDDLDDHCWEYY